jgi:hypothetical protein
LHEDTIKMEFPQFRKLDNGRSLYKITAPDQFIELQQIGSKWMVYTFELQQFPDLLRLQDMLSCQVPFEVLDAHQFNQIYQQTT